MKEVEIKAQLEAGINFPPLMIRVRTQQTDGSDQEIDSILEVNVGENTFQFAAELQSRSTPRAFEESMRKIQQAVKDKQYYPMVVLPYLRETQLDALVGQQMSGIDLSGNGVICVPNQLLVFRTGKPNKYPDSAPYQICIPRNDFACFSCVSYEDHL